MFRVIENQTFHQRAFEVVAGDVFENCTFVDCDFQGYGAVVSQCNFIQYRDILWGPQTLLINNHTTILKSAEECLQWSMD